MKNLLVACAVLVCSAGAAFANSDAYPDFAASPETTVIAGGVLPPLGGQGEPQSANSLPAGFERGTAPYQAAQMVGRYLQDQANQKTHSTAER